MTRQRAHRWIEANHADFRDNVERVTRQREPGVTTEQITKDFGFHTMVLQKWLRPAEIDGGATPGENLAGAAELREAHKQIRLL